MPEAFVVSLDKNSEILKETSDAVIEEKVSAGYDEPKKNKYKARPEKKSKPPKKAKPPKSPKAQEPSETKKKGLFGFFKTPLFKRVYVFLGNASWRKKVLSWMLRSILQFFKIVSFTKFKLFVKAGLDDPAKTGKAFGYFLAAKHALSDGSPKRFDIAYEPDFNNEIFEAQGEIEMATSVGRLCMPVIMAVLTFPYVHTLVLYLRMRKIRME